MINEYLQLQAEMTARAIVVGQTIQRWKYWAYSGVRIPVATPFITNIDNSFVTVVIAYNEYGPVAARIPVPLFEAGNVGDIRTWVTRQNQIHDELLAKQAEDARKAHEDAELSILRELAAKYPEAT